MQGANDGVSVCSSSPSTRCLLPLPSPPPPPTRVNALNPNYQEQKLFPLPLAWSRFILSFGEQKLFQKAMFPAPRLVQVYMPI